MEILVAEDSRASRALLEALLKKWGYDVLSVCDGDEAWAVLKSEDAPKLAILDWMMPGKDGADLCRDVRQLKVDELIYIILLTARGRKEDITEGLSAGANDYVIKPFDNNELRARIQVGCRVIDLQTALVSRVEELKEALSQIKTLQGIIPICMHCHKIRTDEEAWQKMEAYMEEHSEAQFSHSLCPDCLAEHYGE